MNFVRPNQTEEQDKLQKWKRGLRIWILKSLKAAYGLLSKEERVLREL